MVENNGWVPFFSPYGKMKHHIHMAKKSIDAVCHRVFENESIYAEE